MSAPVTADTRLFRSCLAASVLLNLGAALLIGWLDRPDAPDPPQGRPHIRLVTVTVRPAPPASARRGVTSAAHLLVSRPMAPQIVQTRATQADPVRTLDLPPQPVPIARPMLAASTPAPRVVTALRPARLTVPHTPIPPPNLFRAGVAPALPASTPPASVDAAPRAAHSEASRGDAAGGGAGWTGAAGTDTGQQAGGPFGIGDGLAAEGVTRHVVYVLDVSASMSSRIERAEEELTQALDGLRPGETFNVVAFSETSRLFDPDMAEATPAQTQRAATFLRGLEVGGDTNLESAVARALMLRDVNEVVLLTDGVPTLGENGPRQAGGRHPPSQRPARPHLARSVWSAGTPTARTGVLPPLRRSGRSQATAAGRQNW